MRPYYVPMGSSCRKCLHKKSCFVSCFVFIDWRLAARLFMGLLVGHTGQVEHGGPCRHGAKSEG
jgi:hypothetical protein